MIRSLSVLSLLTLSTSAAARPWPVTAGWEIAEAEGGCGMRQQYDGPGETDFTYILETDGDILIGAVNTGWSTHVGQHYQLRYVLNGAAYSGGNSVGVHIGYKSGFATRMASDFAVDFSAAGTLYIYNGDTLVDQLSLEGSAAALSVLRRCVADVGAEMAAAERERQRWAHIPADPFASMPASPQNGGVPGPVSPRPAQQRSGVITNDDYPSAALTAGAQGTTTVRLTVSEAGRVTFCSVAASSGNSALDSTTCRLAMSRFRFAPAVDANGAPIESTVTRTFRWQPPHPAGERALPSQ